MYYREGPARLDAIEARLKAVEKALGNTANDHLTTFIKPDFTGQNFTNGSFVEVAWTTSGYSSCDVFATRFRVRLTSITTHGNITLQLTDGTYQSVFNLATNTATSPGNPALWWNVEVQWAHPWRTYLGDIREQFGSATARVAPPARALRLFLGGTSGVYTGIVYSPWWARWSNFTEYPAATAAGNWITTIAGAG